MPRRFLALFFAVFFALTALFAGTVYVLDPYYHFHGPVLGMPLWLRYPRYQSPGAAKNLPYDHLLLGTSVTANFHTDQFDEALGGRTQKIIIHGAYFEELLRPLDIALETHDLDQIFWGVDSAPDLFPAVFTQGLVKVKSSDASFFCVTRCQVLMILDQSFHRVHRGPHSFVLILLFK